MGDTIKNLRVTLWGVQGSCPYFPTPHEVAEFVRMAAVHTLTKAFEDLANRMKEGKVSYETWLGGPPTKQTIEEYQRKLGLPNLPVFGGDTTCIEVEDADGNIVILDGGTGIRNCALNLVNKKWADRKDRTLYIFGSHEHLDHRNGLPFATFCFVRPNSYTIKIYGNGSFLASLDDRFGLFSRETKEVVSRDAPVNYAIMAAKFEGFEIRELEEDGTIPPHGPWGVHDLGSPVKVGRMTITPFEVYHGATPCLGYVVERKGKKFVFCTDHELRHGNDPKHPSQVESERAEARLRMHLQDAQAAYMDGQYFMAEYMGIRAIGHASAAPRIDWGHSCVEDVVARAQQCRVKRTYIGHHDPDREWGEQVKTDEELARLSRDKPYHVELAKGSTVIDI